MRQKPLHYGSSPSVVPLTHEDTEFSMQFKRITNVTNAKPGVSTCPCLIYLQLVTKDIPRVTDVSGEKITKFSEIKFTQSLRQG